MNILVSRLGMLGDALFTIPTLKQLRALYPNATITYLSAPSGREMIQLSGLTDRIITYNIYHTSIAKLWVSHHLKKLEFDLFINFDASPELHQFFCKWVKTKTVCRMVFKKDETSQDLQLVQHEGPEQRHIAWQYQKLLSLYTHQFPELNYCLDRLPDSAHDWQKTYKNKFNPTGDTLVLGYHFGNHILNTNKYKPQFNARVWNNDYLLTFADLFKKNHPHFLLVLTGGTYEKQYTKPLENRLKKAGIPVVNMTGKTRSIAQLMGLISTFDLFISGDTGPMHVAAAIKTPQIGLFFNADPKDTAPYGDPQFAHYIQSPIACAPCQNTPREYQCPPDTNCVLQVPPQVVLNKALAILKSTAKPK